MQRQDSENPCAICLETLAATGVALFAAECGHSFHFRCIEANASVGNRTCPLCRVEWQTLPLLRPQQLPVSPRVPRHRRLPSWQNNTLRPHSPVSPTSSIGSIGSAAPLRQHNLGPRNYDSDTSSIQSDDEQQMSDDEEIEHDVSEPVVVISAKPNLTIQQDTTTAAAFTSHDITALLTVKAPSAQDSERHSRPGVDLIALLDVSGSMEGDKVSLLRSTLQAAVDLLGPRDRLSIIKFESNAKRLTPLQRMTPAGQEAARAAVAQLSAGGGTDITAALKRGLQVVQSRRHRNPVCSVLLLTDGQDSEAHSGHVPLVAQLRAAGATVSTFGYGGDHDARLLEAIAEAGGGVFTYIADLAAVRRSFGRCLGSLLSVAAQAAALTLRPRGGATLTRIVADGVQRPAAADGGGAATEVEIGELFADLGRDVLVKLRIPALRAAAAEPQAYLEVGLSWLPPGAGEAARERLEPAAAVLVARPAEVSARARAAMEVDPAVKAARQAVDRQLNRVMAVEAIKEAVSAGDTGRLGDARRRLMEAARAVEESATGSEALCQALVKDLKKTAAAIDTPEQYASGGSAMLRSKRLNHQRQRSFGSDESPYSTEVQRICSESISAGMSPPPSPRGGRGRVAGLQHLPLAATAPAEPPSPRARCRVGLTMGRAGSARRAAKEDSGIEAAQELEASTLAGTGKRGGWLSGWLSFLRPGRG